MQSNFCIVYMFKDTPFFCLPLRLINKETFMTVFELDTFY